MTLSQRRERPEHDFESVKLDIPIQARIKTVYRGPSVAFVPHPHINGAWVKVATCVVDRACPHCGAPVGSLCISTTGKYTSAHHYKRRFGEVSP